MITPMLIATVAIFKIGAEILFLKSLFLIKRLTTNNSNFMKIHLTEYAKITALFGLILITACNAQENKSLILGADRTEQYLSDLAEKNVAIVGNQTSLIKTDKGQYIHLVDSLLNRNIGIKKVFAPEHGFRGKADAGEMIKDGIDQKTGLPVVSLYGSNKKPDNTHLQDIDIVVFDIQDVGARFYTYISTLHYIMEACAENDIPLIILDRPNPNGDYIDGPILQKSMKSFVGMHPIPITHGLTIAEYARMINGEKWLNNNLKADLRLIFMKNYHKNLKYEPPVAPSPNLPNYKSIRLYPSLCLFEGTKVSVGRGTSTPFQIFGAPFLPERKYSFTFTPKSSPGAKYPKHENQICYGKKFDNLPQAQLNLKYLIEAYQATADKDIFFNDYFNKLAGNKTLKQKIKSGWTAQEIYASWKKGLDQYKMVKSKYEYYTTLP